MKWASEIEMLRTVEQSVYRFIIPLKKKTKRDTSHRNLAVVWENENVLYTFVYCMHV